MVRAALIIAAIVDLALAALLIGVSGFVFGSGPESVHGGTLLKAAYAGGVVGCLAAPFVGFLVHARGKSAAGMVIAWLPPAGALAAMAIPPPY
jgi:ABC-type multidrug transport system permease subunit